MGKIVNSSLLLMASYQDFIPNQLSKSFNTWITSSLKSWKLSMKIAWRTWSSSSCRSMQLSSISIALNILYSREFYYIQSPQSPMVEVAPRIFLWLRAFVIVKESKQKLTMVNFACWLKHFSEGFLFQFCQSNCNFMTKQVSSDILLLLTKTGRLFFGDARNSCRWRDTYLN